MTRLRLLALSLFPLGKALTPATLSTAPPVPLSQDTPDCETPSPNLTPDRDFGIVSWARRARDGGINENPEIVSGLLGDLGGVDENPEISSGRLAELGEASGEAVGSASSTARPSSAAACPFRLSETSCATARQRRRHRAAKERGPRQRRRRDGESAGGRTAPETSSVARRVSLRSLGAACRQ